MKKGILISVLLIMFMFIAACANQNNNMANETDKNADSTAKDTGADSSTDDKTTPDKNSDTTNDQVIVTDKPCQDSDGGKLQNVKGYVVDDKGNKYDDSCASNQQVKEYFCNAYGYIDSEAVSCLSGEKCADGRCVKDTTTSKCSDSDGRTAYKKGITTDPTGEYTDTCLNKDTVTEYWCPDIGDFKKSEYINCKSGETCSEGICVPSNETSTCYDSDILDQYNAGYVTDPLGTYYDYCDSKSSVIEYKCNSVGYMDKRYIACDDGCTDGACNPSESTDIVKDTSQLSTCSDSDGGYELGIKGTVTDRVTKYTDFCVNPTKIKEYYCDTLGYKVAKEVLCDSGDECIDGACGTIDPANACSDTDNGNDIYTKGSVTDFKVKYDDYCTPSGILVEYRCSDLTNHMTNQNTNCQKGCSDGACLP